jgi:hypothetical protein
MDPIQWTISPEGASSPANGGVLPEEFVIRKPAALIKWDYFDP